MKRLHLIAIIILLASAMVAALSGTMHGYDFIMSDAMTHNILRATLLVALVAILFTKRPRSIVMRSFCAMTAAVVLGVSLSQAADSQLGIIDTATYFLCSFVLLIEALEPEQRREIVFSDQLSSN